MSSEEKPLSAGSSYRVPKTILMTLVGLYSLSNFILFISSTVAWSKTRKHALDTGCLADGSTSCGFTRWAIYSFISAVSFINTISTLIVLIYGSMRTRGTNVDPLYVFRVSFFTLLLLAAVVYIGWTSLQAVSDGMSSPGKRFSPRGKYPVLASQPPPFAGIGGGFVLEVLDHKFMGAKAAYYMAHVSVMFGALVTAVAAALAPAAAVLFSSQASPGTAGAV